MHLTIWQQDPRRLTRNPLQSLWLWRLGFSEWLITTGITLCNVYRQKLLKWHSSLSLVKTVKSLKNKEAPSCLKLQLCFSWAANISMLTGWRSAGGMFTIFVNEGLSLIRGILGEKSKWTPDRTLLLLEELVEEAFTEKQEKLEIKKYLC